MSIETNGTAQNAPGSSGYTEGFLFLPSFRESYECFRETGNEDLAYEFLQAVIEYGTEGRYKSKDPAIRAVMASIAKTIDMGKRKRQDKLDKQAKRQANRERKAQT